MWTWKELKKLLLEKAAADYTDTAVIVWPVVYPTDMLPPSEPHCTIIYLGDIANLDREAVIEAIKETEHEVFIWAKPTGVEYFGLEKDIAVLRIEHTYLHRYHDFLTSALGKRGIHSASEFPEYKPHVTLSEEAIANDLIPTEPMLLLPVQLWWGGEKIDITDELSLPVRTAL